MLTKEEVEEYQHELIDAIYNIVYPVIEVPWWKKILGKLGLIKTEEKRELGTTRVSEFNKKGE